MRSKNVCLRTVVTQKRGTARILFACLAVGATTGCVTATDVTDADEEATASEQSIIGGSNITDAQRRTLGLATVNNSSCSSTMLNLDWIITATHCLNLGSVSSNFFRIPRSDGTGNDTRTAVVISQLGVTDGSIVKLSDRTASMQWPAVSHAALSVAPSTLVNTSQVMYGQGLTSYGGTTTGTWKSLTRTVSSFSSNILWIFPDANGSNIIMGGDSGGPMIVNNQIAGVLSTSHTTCTNNVPGPCATWQDVIRVNDAGYRTTYDFANYINNAPNRLVTHFIPLTLQNGWQAYQFPGQPDAIATARPAANLQSGVVTLRGGISTTGTNAVAFTLPSGYRPSSAVYVTTDTNGGTKGRLLIGTDGTVTVQSEGAFSNSASFTSLEGVSFAVSNASFTSLALQNGWTNAPFGTRNAAVRDVGGLIRFQGGIRAGTASLIFNLPAAFRPSTDVWVPVGLTLARKGRLLIQPNGNVSVFALNNFADAQDFVSLEGVSFSTPGAIYGAITPAAGWTNAPFSTRNLAVRDDAGVVRFRGALGTSGSNNLAFTLSAALRPATWVYLPVDLCNAAKGRLAINPDGTARVVNENGAPFSGTCFVSLEGVSFGI